VRALRKLIFWLIGAVAIVACLKRHFRLPIVETQCTASPQPRTPERGIRHQNSRFTGGQKATAI